MTAAIAVPNASFENECYPEKLHLIDQLKSEQFTSPSYVSESETWAIAFAPDDSYFAWSCGYKTVIVVPWKQAQQSSKEREIDNDVKDAKMPFIIECNDYVWSIAFGSTEGQGNAGSSSGKWPDFYNFHSPQNRLVLAVGLKCGRIRLYSIHAAKFITELIDHSNLVRQLQFSLDGSLILLSASRDSTLKLWNLYDDCNMFKTLLQHGRTEWVMCCAWSSDGKYLASGGNNKTLFVYRREDYTLFQNLRGHVHTVSSCEFSPDGSLLASASYDTTIILWNFITNERLATFYHLLPPPRPIYASGANEFYVRSLCFSPDGEHLSTVCDDGYVRVWSIFNSDRPIVAATEISNAVCTKFSSDGTCLSVGTREGHVHLFWSPMRVQNLMQICRRSVRMHVDYEDIDTLPLCPFLKTYLRYPPL